MQFAGRFLKVVWDKVRGRPNASADNKSVSVAGSVRGGLISSGDIHIHGDLIQRDATPGRVEEQVKIQIEEIREEVRQLKERDQDPTAADDVSKRLMSLPVGIPHLQAIQARPASESTVREISVSTAGFAVGQTIDVDVVVDAQAPGLAGSLIDVLYDPAVVRAIGCWSHGHHSELCNHAFMPNVVRFATVSPKGYLGNFTIGTIRFEAIQPGESALHIEVVEMVDPEGNAIESTKINHGKLTVFPPATSAS